MKKIINGKKYDTDTATLICQDEYGEGSRDFHWYEISLYRKHNGEFFQACRGGAASQFGRQIASNEWSGGSCIIPMNEAQARDFAEQHMDADEYEEIFGEVAE